MEKPTLSVLLGAGSTADVGLPRSATGLSSTSDLTEAVSGLHGPLAVLQGTPMFFGTERPGEKPSRLDQPVSVCRVIRNALDAEYEEVNFELILQALDELQVLADASRFSLMLDNFRPILAAFVEMQRKYAFLCDPLLLRQARQRVIAEIFRRIIDRTCQCGGAQRAAQKTAEFLGALADKFRLAVFTLNYDDIVDHALPDWFDGFEPDSSQASRRPLKRFNPRKFVERAQLEDRLLVHLHGSVRFGISSKHKGLVKFENSDQALESATWHVPPDLTVSGRVVSAAPIISGLEKAAKLVYRASPFGYYYKAFVDSLLENPRLLLVGYGGRDEHVNTWLTEFYDRHGDDRKVVCICKFSGHDVWENTPETNYTAMLAGGSKNWKEWMAYESAEIPQFQEHGPNLCLVPSGFPLKDSDALEKIIAFLLGSH